MDKDTSLVSDLTPTQHTVACELFSRATQLNSHGDAAIIVGQIETLITDGQTSMRIIRWLNLLPRAVGPLPPAPELFTPTDEQMTLLNPADELPQPVQHAMQPASGQKRPGNADWLLDPDSAPVKVKKRGRPDVGVCREPVPHHSAGTAIGVRECGESFEMNPVGRPLTKCPRHRRSQPQRKEAS